MDSGWSLTDSKAQKLIAKLKTKGKPLGEYVNGKIFYGIKTGLNEAFVIDEETRNSLIEEDPRSSEIIKPFLSGRDIKKYKTLPIKKYLILFKSGDTKNWFGQELTEGQAKELMIKKYPSIMNFLLKFEEKAKARSDKGNFWWELRACDYYDEFEKEKIAWPETSLDNQFSMVEKGSILNKTAFIIPVDDKSLLAQLNSSIARFYFDSVVSKMRGGYFSMSKAYVETFPIVDNTNEKLNQKVTEITALKKDGMKADTNSLEQDIDQMVYELYELTEEEIKIVEGGVG